MYSDGRFRGRWPVIALLALLLVGFAPGAARADDEFDHARELAFSGERDAARSALTELLSERPEHWDARVLLGRLYAWDGRYDEAREQLLVVVRARPDYADARCALADVELWSESYERAVSVLREGLEREPNRQEFLLRLARAQEKLGRVEDAAVTLDQLLQINPSNAEGQRMFRRIRVGRLRNKIGMSYGYTGIDDLDRPWHEASLQLSTRTAIGSVIARVNYANRFDRSSAQYEIDAYPRIANGLYLYLNYGYSASRLYPQHRYAAEAYANVPGGVELSAGFRQLRFESSTVTIYTGTLAKYQGNWWISLRPYITPKSEGTSRSYQLTVRRYLGGADTWLGVTGGIGSSPGEILDTSDLVRRDSWKIGLRGQAAIGDLFLLKYSAGLDHEDLLSGRERQRFSVGFGVERRF